MNIPIVAYTLMAAGGAALAPAAPAPPPAQGAAPRAVHTATVTRVISDEAAQKELAELEAQLVGYQARERDLAARLAQVAESDRGRREALQREMETLRRTLTESTRRRELLKEALGAANLYARAAVGALRPPKDVRLNLELENATANDAYRQIFERAKEEFTVEGELPADKRLTVRAENVQLHTALDLVSEATGVGWAREAGGEYKVGKSVRSGPLFYLRDGHQGFFFRDFPGVPGVPGVPGAQGGKITPSPFTMRLAPLAVIEERSAFSCPHCKGQVTVLRRRQQPKCTKCERLFQPEWQFCPADGAKRPETGREWKFCPMCGKEVKMEKSEAVPVPGAVFLLGAVSAPGQFPLEEGLRLRGALARAGGATPEANPRHIVILHRDRTVTRVDLLNVDEEPRDPLLQDGDAVLVPPATEVSRDEPTGAAVVPLC